MQKHLSEFAIGESGTIVSVDGEKVTDPATKITAEALKTGVVIKKGKKVFHKFTV